MAVPVTPEEPKLDAAIAAYHLLQMAKFDYAEAIKDAHDAGWSFESISAALGVPASTVWRTAQTKKEGEK